MTASEFLKNENKSSPLRSKKFCAALLFSMAHSLALWLAILDGLPAEVLIAIIHAQMMVQGLYLGGQSAVDAIVRRAFATTQKSP